MRPMFAGIVAAVVASAAQFAAADNYPEKPIRFVVPYAAGGTTDLLSRAIAQKLSEAVGQPVIPDNRPGAGGNVGAEIVAKSPPDGYTMLMAPVSPMAINVTLYGSKMAFNPEKDFAPVTLVAKVPLVVVVHPAVPANTLQDLIALGKSKPATPASAIVGTCGSAGERFAPDTARARRCPAFTIAATVGTCPIRTSICPATSAIIPGPPPR